jgi:hypothetical protein
LCFFQSAVSVVYKRLFSSSREVNPDFFSVKSQNGGGGGGGGVGRVIDFVESKCMQIIWGAQ